MQCKAVIKMIGKHVGNYVIERKLEKGEMGAVFLARDRALGREVAIKFIGDGPECAADIATRFLDEARITASLQHPNIVTVFDFGELEGRPYYAMELLVGSNLDALMQSNKRFGVEQVKEYVDQICSGLHAAHAVGVVHQDLKPSNIFVVGGEPLRIKLMNFGVAKIMSIGDDDTYHGQIVGTPRYMSPEQAKGDAEEISPRSDIYSLGVIVYEMLTGASVFANEFPVMLLMMHIQSPVPKIRDLVPEISRDIAELVESCLAKDPNDRPQSVLEIRERFAEATFELSADLRPESAVRVSLAERECAPRASVPGLDEHDTKVCIAPAMEAPVSKKPKPVTRTLRLDRADRVTLKRLYGEMQKRGEFPEFVRSWRAVGKHSHFDSTYSASELGESLLEDHALSAKLLRIINSAYASRFSGKVDSISHAIVILGVDRVRSIALIIYLFENQGTDAQLPRVSESAIRSLVSGEIAQQFAAYAQVSDSEQAMLCGTLRNFGRHLAIVYLPNWYDQMVAVSQSNNVDLEIAAERILGISLRKLGLGVAELWQLPKPILGVMSNVPGLSGRWAREEDRMVALAEFSNELCELVATESAQARPLAISNLLLQHRALLTIEPETMAELLQSAQESFERRYSSLLGLDSTKCSFYRNVAALVPTPERQLELLDTEDDELTPEITWVAARNVAT